jgi:cell division initiation protein
MKLTPLDIQHMRFKSRPLGYRRLEVDHFLEDVAKTVEDLNRENQQLREALAASETQVAELRKAETALTQTLVTTHAMAEELKLAAQREAELLIKEAELKAADLLRQSQHEVAALCREVSDLRKQRALALERLRSTLKTFERILEVETAGDDLAHVAEAVHTSMS